MKKETAVFAVTDGPKDVGTLTLSNDHIDWRPAGSEKSYSWSWPGFNGMMIDICSWMEKRRKR